jgi:hypothetical protein
MTREEVYDRIREVLGEEGLEEVLEGVKAPPEEWDRKKEDLRDYLFRNDVFRPESIDTILEALRQNETGEPSLVTHYEHKITRATTIHDLDNLLNSISKAETLEPNQKAQLNLHANYRYAVLVCSYKNKVPQPIMKYKKYTAKGVERRAVWVKGRRGIYAVLTLQPKAYKIK